MSLDGFVADVDDGVDLVFKWYAAGATDAAVMIGGEAVQMSQEGAEFIEESGRGAGVLVTARRTFDLAKAWGGKHPMGVPMVVLTHRVPEEWANREGSPFTFVTDGGVPKAIEIARQIASAKDVVVGAPSVTQECLRLGLLNPHRPRSRGARTRDPAVRSPDGTDRTASHRGFRQPSRNAHHLFRRQVVAT